MLTIFPKPLYRRDNNSPERRPSTAHGIRGWRVVERRWAESRAEATREAYPRNYLSRSAPVRRKPVPRRVKESLPDRAPCHRRRLNAIETPRGQIMGTRERAARLHAERPRCVRKAHCRARRARPLWDHRRKGEITRPANFRPTYPREM